MNRLTVENTALRTVNLGMGSGYINTDELWMWRKAVIDGKVERKSGSVILCADDGSEIMRYNFFEAWPYYRLGGDGGLFDPADRGLGRDVQVDRLHQSVLGVEGVAARYARTALPLVARAYARLAKADAIYAAPTRRLLMRTGLGAMRVAEDEALATPICATG